MSTLTTEQKRSAQSSLVQINSNGSIRISPTPIQCYAAELWDALSEKDTAMTYQKAVDKTWKLLKTFLALVFFVFLFSVALIVSLWGIGFNLGGQLQKWLDNNGQGRQPDELLKELLNILLLPIKKIIEWANNYVQKYLGWDTSACKFFDSTDEPKS